MCLHCIVLIETLIGVFTVHCVEWDTYWYLYSDSVDWDYNSFFTVHSVEWDTYWCLYSAQCRVSPLFVCVQITAKMKAVIGVLQCTHRNKWLIGFCTLHSVKYVCYLCWYSVKFWVKLLLVCVECSEENFVYLCVYSAKCRVGIFLMWVHCTV